MNIYVGRWDLIAGGIDEVESLTEEEAKREIERQQRHDPKDRRIDTYTPEELEVEFNNDLDEEDPFSLRYWIKIF